jgi:hypothetical protein
VSYRAYRGGIGVLLLEQLPPTRYNLFHSFAIPRNNNSAVVALRNALVFRPPPTAPIGHARLFSCSFFIDS